MRSSKTPIFLVICTLIQSIAAESEFNLNVNHARVKRAPVDDLITVACTHHPEMSFCSKLLTELTETRSKESSNDIQEDNSGENIIEDLLNERSPSNSTDYDVRNSTIVTDELDLLSSSPSPSSTPTPDNEIPEYCTQYTDHYEHFCIQNAETNSDQAHKFCKNYARACDKEYDYERRLLTVYCSRYRAQYSQICPNALKYGLRAVEFCPTFAEVCGNTIDTGPLLVLKTFPTIATTSPQPDFRRQNTLDLNSIREATIRPPKAGAGTGEWSPSRVQATCQQYTALYNQLCHTPAAKTGQGFLGQKCALYETHCR